MADEHDVLADVEFVQERVDVGLVLGQRVAGVARARQLGRVAVANEIGRDHAAVAAL